jgi:hypothetical protein
MTPERQARGFRFYITPGSLSQWPMTDLVLKYSPWSASTARAISTLTGEALKMSDERGIDTCDMAGLLCLFSLQSIWRADLLV